MPNRMLRDWTNSDKINSLSVYAERFFTRLIMKVDDYGRYYADPRLLKAGLFPLKLDGIREADLLRWMAECQKAGLIVVYDCANKRYLQIADFNQRLRQKTQKYPASEEGIIIQPDDGHVSDNGQTMVGTKRREVEEEEKGTLAPDSLRPIEECLQIALRDPRWIKANSVKESDLVEFNKLLEKRGEYDKTPADYKKHFANRAELEKEEKQQGSKKEMVM